jgi:hypothetical protein
MRCFVAKRLPHSVDLYERGGLPNPIPGKRSQRLVPNVGIAVRHLEVQIENGFPEYLGEHTTKISNPEV